VGVWSAAIAVAATPTTATLTVTDTGLGIEPELLAHVFEPFTQGDTSRARAAGGLGIGLTVVRQLVQLHGGTVEARSQGRGRGTTFEIRLPLSDLVPRVTREPAPRAAMSPRRILIVDDNRDARELLRTILELDGHQVQDAAEAGHAVRIAAEWAPDVALIDIGLPEVDGYEVARRIRKRLGNAIRLIALTGYGDDEARRLSADAGFDEHLVKPVDPDVLRDLLAEAAGRSAGQPLHLSPVLAELARRERYLALEVRGQRYNIGVKYGLLTAQLALALDGVDREKILGQIVDLLAQRV
jgi:CheY-like chemotaxis protein